MSVTFYQAFTDIVQVDKANPMLMSSIIRSYENGEYEKTLSLLEDYLYDTQSVDIYCLFLSFSCDIFLNTPSINDLVYRLKDYNETLQHCAPQLSPKINFDASLHSALDILCSMLSLKFTEARKKDTVNDFDSLQGNFNSLFTQVANLDGIERSLTTHQGFKDSQKALMLLDRRDLEPETLQPEPEVEPTETRKEPKKKGNANLVDKYASPKWYALIRKASILQKLLLEERHFESAIIYKDIQAEIKNFDPLVYFPGLFFPLLKSVAPKAPTLQKHIDKHKDTLEWDMANRLYQSDPMRFANELPMMMMNQYRDEQFYRSEEEDEQQHHPEYEQDMPMGMDDDYQDDEDFGSMRFNDEYQFQEDDHEMIPSERSSENEISDLVNDIDAMTDDFDY